MPRKQIDNRSPAPVTTHLSTGTGPSLREQELRENPRAFLLDELELADQEGRRGAGRRWRWDLFERAYVEGVIGYDDKRRWPTMRELASWSGCSADVIKNRSSQNRWDSKKLLHEERIPQLVEEAAAKHMAAHVGAYLAGADEAVKRKSAEEWVHSIAEPYLERTLQRVAGKDPEFPIPAPNVQDAERLLKLLLLVSGNKTERDVLVKLVQANIDLQARATREALELCAAQGLFAEELLADILREIEARVGRVKWVLTPATITQ